MRLLVTGASGQLGHDVKRVFFKEGDMVVGVDSKTLNVTDEKKVMNFITGNNFDAVIHCAAYTAVDLAEEEMEKCFEVNVTGTKNIALACKKAGIKMIYISSDYVFDGTKRSPYETDDKPNPVNIYGKTKYLGELEVLNNVDKHFIIRVSWVFGKNGKNFVKTMLKLGREKGELNVVSDQIGSPTYALDAARLISQMIKSDKYGIYHATNEGFCSWYDFSREIFKEAGIKTKVNPITSDKYPTKAIRPKNSRLSKIKLMENNFNLLPSWQDALKRYLREIGEI